MLTGESIPVIKNQLPKTKKIFDSNNDTLHILYSGTKCLEVKRPNGGKDPVLGLVLKTGFSTMKGRLVRSLLYLKPENFKFYSDAIKYTMILASLAMVGMIYSIYMLIKADITTEMIVVHSLDILTIAVPPALATCLTIASEIATNRLERKQILTKSQNKIIVGGRVNTMCFDKTGTLTEDSLDLYGVKTTKINGGGNLAFGSTVKEEYHHKLNITEDNQEGKSHSQLMLELMATCHSLAYIRGNLSGDPLDFKMFESISWGYRDDSTEHSNACRVIPPVGAEDSGYFRPSSQVLLLKRFEFVPKLQRMSVIITDPKEQGQRVYVKGSPEVIKSLSRPETLPRDFSKRLAQYTENGLRVIACATKKLEKEVPISDDLERSEFEHSLEFLGFLIFENKLKPVTKEIIDKLTEANIRSVMITGDNPLTAIYVARECGIVDPNQTVLLALVQNDENNPEVKRLYWKNMEPLKNKFQDQAQRRISSVIDIKRFSEGLYGV